MNFNGGDAGDGQPLVDREPPSFPRVDDSQATDPNRAPSAPLFAPAGPPGRGAQMSDVVSRPIAAEPTTGRGNGGRIRWLVAGLATLLVVAVVGGVLFLAAPHAGTPSATAHYVPADPAMYAELRLDLPGDQHDNLAAFMSHFPGFADQAAFQQKLDESLKSLVTRESSGAITGTTTSSRGLAVRLPSSEIRTAASATSRSPRAHLRRPRRLRSSSRSPFPTRQSCSRPLTPTPEARRSRRSTTRASRSRPSPSPPAGRRRPRT